MAPLAEIPLPQGSLALHAAASLTLHGEASWRADGNSPALVRNKDTLVFFSSYEPRGHTLRRQGPLATLDLPVPVVIRNDPDQAVGKWIEAIWPAPDGRLFGWYHAEEHPPAPSPLYLPHIGEVVSQDDGLTWECRGEILRAPPGETDISYRNGFCAGGFGDLCVLPDRQQAFLYMPFSSFVRTEASQGVCMARLPLPRGDRPADGLEIWSGNAWRRGAQHLPQPLWPTARGWRHPDPDAFWGPAVHYNRAIDAYVMLLNRTAGGNRNMVQEGIYVSVNPDLAEPKGWSQPIKLVQGGAWYPQVIGLEPGDGDTRAGRRSQFYMAGFSAWEMEITTERVAHAGRPMMLTTADFAPLFGKGMRAPW